jgi:predicted alpha/beta-fold hydrolase
MSAFEIPPFRPRWPWLGPDLQTLRNFFVRPAPDFTAWPAKDLWFLAEDGTGDCLHGTLHENGGALVTVIHGLTGCSESYHVLSTARSLLDAGHSVLRLNLRNAGATLGQCREQYTAGRTQDLRLVFGRLAAGHPGRPLAAVGYSLSGNMLLKYLGEAGTESGLAAAVSVSAPIDLKATSLRFHRTRNWLYKRYLLAGMKRDTLRLRNLAPEHAAAVRAVTSVYDYDDRYLAPRYGFGNAETYYARSSALPFLPAIRTPTLIINADDDPWIPPEPYRGFDWARNPALIPALIGHGGHVGFHGRGSRLPWHDRLIRRFIARLEK